MAFIRTSLTLAAIAAAFAAGAWAQKIGALAPATTSYLKLTAPLPVAADGGGVLPAGTALYHDTAFAEGHMRYIVYVNIKGEVAADKVVEHQRNLVDPIWGYPDTARTPAAASTPANAGKE